MSRERLRRVHVLMNPKSGLGLSFDSVRRALEKHWEGPGTDLVYQFCRDIDDGFAKARRAAEAGADVLLAVGGDGTVSTVGRAILGSGVALGVIPTGSGNGFARHFGIPLSPERAVAALAKATVKRIDVGVVNDRPFLVTCSMAWDAKIVRSFERAKIRGSVLPYIFAGAYEFFDYKPQDIRVDLDSGEQMTFHHALVFTVANLTEYGGGAKIAPEARPDDGRLELVVALHQDVPKLFSNIGRLFNGSLRELPEVIFRRFRAMTVKREHAAPIQMDGELMDAPAKILVRVRPEALRVLIPIPPAGKA